MGKIESAIVGFLALSAMWFLVLLLSLFTSFVVKQIRSDCDGHELRRTLAREVK